jgi:2-polyprenyl-6-methoxyphenol hydroxylase-like FAD-dependent oxidoreductase
VIRAGERVALTDPAIAERAKRMSEIRKAAIIGGGVIGGGWAARFLLNGWDVIVSDPDPEAERKVGEVLANARRSLPALSDVSVPKEGRLSFAASIADAVAAPTGSRRACPSGSTSSTRYLPTSRNTAAPTR